MLLIDVGSAQMKAMYLDLESGIVIEKKMNHVLRAEEVDSLEAFETQLKNALVEQLGFHLDRVFVGLSQAWRDALEEDTWASDLPESFPLLLDGQTVSVTTRILEQEFEAGMDHAAVKHACAEFGPGFELAMALGVGAGSMQLCTLERAFLAEFGSVGIGSQEDREAERVASKLLDRILERACLSDTLTRMNHETKVPLIVLYSGLGHALQHPAECSIYPSNKLKDLSQRLPDISKLTDPKARGAALMAKFLLEYLGNLAEQRVLFVVAAGRRLGKVVLGWHSAVLMDLACCEVEVQPL